MSDMSTRTSDFHYELPHELIAYRPKDRRDQSRLMVLNRDNQDIEHLVFSDLPSFLKKGDVIILNDTKVIPARLPCTTESGKEIEILLEEKVSPNSWKLLMKGPREGMKLQFADSVVGLVKKDPHLGWLIRFDASMDEYIERTGFMPLPPYIKRKPDLSDREKYQTVYARKLGAIAAPTAGLHFTHDLLEKIRRKGVEIEYITLHVGAGTFVPVKTEDIRNHKLHSEKVEISSHSAGVINRAIAQSRRIVAVGTTVVRALESAAEGNAVQPGSYRTDLFIYPPYSFKVVDCMITNFHLPRSTLLMLVCAFAGREFVLRAYREAVNKRYRFLSYGDAMFIC